MTTQEYKDKCKRTHRCYNCARLLPTSYKKIRCESCLIHQRATNKRWRKNNPDYMKNWLKQHPGYMKEHYKVMKERRQSGPYGV